MKIENVGTLDSHLLKSFCSTVYLTRVLNRGFDHFTETGCTFEWYGILAQLYSPDQIGGCSGKISLQRIGKIAVFIAVLIPIFIRTV